MCLFLSSVMLHCFGDKSSYTDCTNSSHAMESHTKAENQPTIVSVFLWYIIFHLFPYHSDCTKCWLQWIKVWIKIKLKFFKLKFLHGGCRSLEISMWETFLQPRWNLRYHVGHNKPESEEHILTWLSLLILIGLKIFDMIEL